LINSIKIQFMMTISWNDFIFIVITSINYDFKNGWHSYIMHFLSFHFKQIHGCRDWYVKQSLFHLHSFTHSLGCQNAPALPNAD
jgi:hypothetical protein